MAAAEPRAHRSAWRTVRRVLGWAGALLLVAAVGLAIWIGPMIYRVVHGLDIYETVPPELPADLRPPAVLVFSKTNGFRHAEAIPAARAMFRELAKARGWRLVETDNAAVFNPEQLARFRTVVWNNVSGDVLTMAQRDALVRWLQGGGGFVGVHATGGDTAYRWRWYVERLIGAQFIGHTLSPHLQTATLRVADPRHPIMAGVPADWRREDEYYSFDRSVRTRGYHVLLTVDEASYKPVGLFGQDLRMGAEHPLAWTHCVGAGRVFYSALGHTAASYAEPAYRRMLGQAVDWAGRGGCTGTR